MTSLDNANKEQTFLDEHAKTFAINTDDTYISSRNLDADVRPYYVAHKFLETDTGEPYEVWVDQHGGELIMSVEDTKH